MTWKESCALAAKIVEYLEQRGKKISAHEQEVIATIIFTCKNLKFDFVNEVWIKD